MRHRAWLIIALTVTMMVWTTALPAVAHPLETGPNAEPCPGISSRLQLGTTTPVLLVHGFGEGPGVFTQAGSPTLTQAINTALGSSVTLVPFDYSNWNLLWVTFEEIGPRLATCITWLAHTSATQGGPGKVIIVAHSMGGLAVRCAVDPTCVQGIQAADPSLIGLVITLGTPNTGSNPQTLGPVLDTICMLFSQCNDLLIARDSPAAQAMVPGSSQLAKLPLLPAAIPVDAIAGQITETTELFNHSYVLNDFGDIVVPVTSALADAEQGALHAGPGANKTTVNCGTVPVWDLAVWIGQSIAQKTLASPATCWHLTETTNAVWQQDIIAAIKPAVQALAPIDWNNRSYALTCDNTVQTPVNVAFSGGNATATGPGIGPYNQWDISIDQVTHGVLPSLGNVTAVLFGCSPQPSNFSVGEMRIYRTANGSEVGRIPELPDNGGVLPGVYKKGSVTIANGHVSADMMFYGPGESQASGPSVPGHMSWTWDGQEFTSTSPPGQTTPTGACPDSAQLLSAWNAASATLRNSWAAAPITGFTNISCWNGWVVAVPVSPSPGNGEFVFSLAGNLHLITTTELNQQFTQEVCSSPNAPSDWKGPPLISCTNLLRAHHHSHLRPGIGGRSRHIRSWARTGSSAPARKDIDGAMWSVGSWELCQRGGRLREVCHGEQPKSPRAAQRAAYLYFMAWRRVAGLMGTTLRLAERYCAHDGNALSCSHPQASLPVTVAGMSADDEWTPGDVASMIANPFYAINIDEGLAVHHEPLISEDDRVKANVRLIDELGAEPYLRNLLSALKGNYPRGS